MGLRIKICGLRDPQQAVAIADLGATAIGFIAVEQSPRYVSPAQVAQLTQVLQATHPTVDRVGVFANATQAELEAYVTAGITSIQLHGSETPSDCQYWRDLFPEVEMIKALRIRSKADLALAEIFAECVDTLLLDAYHPQMLGGTGATLDWQSLQAFHPPRPWLLAGGLTPENVSEALFQLQPAGIDLSSGVERSPGNKDLTKVATLFAALSATGIN
ncbi:phosphoribosylanthranilate isomerase [Synechococcus elongatus]|uniref:N-(5'-phosphoribosyl)anthranilate isomerase n=1 Tax=Synechococcus elongatus PCC 11801 TaxID=2219813 RepID=A0AAN1UTI8_SYNEL|nr:phosphoribosylanthranilate isomerase [Synechococcus elongatus]AZB71582.1 phosphoribosylanthranilate isomerase [Synechococcus elongatus PCC 11801]